MKETVEAGARRSRPAWRVRLRHSMQLWRVEPRTNDDSPTELGIGQQPGPTWILPMTCANCGANAGQTARYQVGYQTLLIPYCARCLRAAEREKTRFAVAVAASLLLGLTLLVVLPWVGLNLPLPAYVAISVCGVLLPLGAVAFLTGEQGEGQTSAGVAVWWARGALTGSNHEWMAQLAEQNGAALAPVRGRAPSVSWSAATLPLSVAAIGPATYALFFPTLVVLNLSAHDIQLWVDGRMVERIQVSSLESADAGKRLSLSAGAHVLEARAVSNGELVEQARVALDAGERYLFAPGSIDYCFWLETDTYGKATQAKQLRRLRGNGGFFPLPARIDSWFAANPEPGADTRSSGGDMVALRHARCQDAPAAATGN